MRRRSSGQSFRATPRRKLRFSSRSCARWSRSRLPSRPPRRWGAPALAPSLGLREIELDFMELCGLGVAVEKVRAAGLRVVIATPRVQKPGEEGYDARFERLKPDGILARHLGGLEHFRRLGTPWARAGQGFTVHGDFSLNATNAVTARTLLGLGL